MKVRASVKPLLQEKNQNNRRNIRQRYENTQYKQIYYRKTERQANDENKNAGHIK